MTDLSDAILVQRCLERVPGAWELLVDRNADLVYGIARRSGLDADAAEDVVQDVFVILLRTLPRLRQHDRLMGFLVKTARRASWRAGRRARARRARDEAVAAPEGDPRPLPDAEVASLERAAILRRALAQLGPRCRQLLTALFLREATDYKALAEELGMAVGSIGPTRRRCMDKLLVLLDAEGIRPGDVSAAQGKGSGESGQHHERGAS